MKDKKLYFRVVTSARDNQKLSKIPTKVIERLIDWNKYKTKSENKNTKNEYRYFLELNFVGKNQFFVLVYRNQDEACKRFRTRRYYLPKDIIESCNMITSVKDLNDQSIDSDISWYEEIRKLSTG